MINQQVITLVLIYLNILLVALRLLLHLKNLFTDPSKKFYEFLSKRVELFLSTVLSLVLEIQKILSSVIQDQLKEQLQEEIKKFFEDKEQLPQEKIDSLKETVSEMSKSYQARQH